MQQSSRKNRIKPWLVSAVIVGTTLLIFDVTAAPAPNGNANGLGMGVGAPGAGGGGRAPGALPPGLAAQAELPPGLAKKDTLPPGLTGNTPVDPTPDPAPAP
ncbi:MAG: hypothetical protein PVF34_01900 [Gammaproteobacteria bacterium]|jgi:hypothetical protein